MVKSSVNYKNIFFGAISGTFGVYTAMAIMGLWSVIFLWAGYELIKHYSKKDTDLLEDLHGVQYLGVILCFIGMLPWLPYFFAGLAEGLGDIAIDKLLDN